tara:strand:- start:285 stop:560 length:276 start_codon:yes stop_codon:yes gene_type:complete
MLEQEEQTRMVTFLYDEKTYDANKFTKDGKYAVIRISRLDAEIKALLEQVDDKRAAAMTYQTTIVSQLTEDMLVDEAAAEPDLFETNNEET